MFSLETLAVNSVIESSDNLRGVDYDPATNKIYFCSLTTVFRANMDGSGIETMVTAEISECVCYLAIFRCRSEASIIVNFLSI